MTNLDMTPAVQTFHDNGRFDEVLPISCQVSHGARLGSRPQV
jgi:hypothetical protein